MDALTTTENGAATYSSSDNAHVDFFFKTVRSLPKDDFLKLFRSALIMEHIDAVVLLFHMRDARYGKGEIRMFKWALRDIAKHSGVHPIALAIMHLIPDYGCWHDLLVFADTPLQPQMVKMFADQLQRDVARDCANGRISLAAKWAPREGKKYHTVARAIIAAMGIGAAEYRKMLRRLCERIGVIETQLSMGVYDSVNFSHVPAKAMHRYAKTFQRNATLRYAAYLQSVRDGRAQMKVSQMEPHAILKPYLYGTDNDVNDTIEVAWTEYVRVCQTKYPHLGGFLPVIDVSGSMAGTPLEVAVTLGMLLMECNKGRFYRKWVTFSGQPEFGEVSGDTVLSRVQSLRNGSWGLNTDINAVTRLLIDSARMWNLQRDQLPHTIVIFSDMEFDEAAGTHATNYEQIRADYAAAGMEMPKIVFWNLTASKSTPVRHGDDNCALVSGFSPALFNLFIQVGEINPGVVMRQVLCDQRYDAVRNAVANIGK